MIHLKRRAVYIVLLVLLTLFGASAVITATRFWEQESVLWQTQTNSNLWYAGELERALQECLEVLSKAETAPNATGPNDVVRELDVLWSRLNLISASAPEPQATLYRDHRDVFDDLRDRLVQVDAKIARLHTGDVAVLRKVYDLLSPARDGLHRVTLSAVQSDMSGDNEVRNNISSLAQTLVIDISVVGFCGLALVFLLFRQVGREERANRQAVAATDLLRQAVDSIPDGVGLFEKDGRLAMCNSAFLEIAGFKDEVDVVGKSFEALLSFGLENNHYSRSGRTVREWEKWRLDSFNNGGECQYELAEGNWVLARDIHIPSGGVICLRYDISDQVRTEERLRRALHESRNATQAKSEFLAIMSHEMRTPLNGVLGLLGLLMDSELDPEQRGYALTARESGEMLLSLIEDILDFSKIEAGKLTLEDTDFNPTEVVQGVVELLASRAHAKGIEIACYVDHSVPDELRGDPGRLRQVLLNLAGNAVKFTERGGVTVELAMVAEDGDDVTLSGVVTDTGIGIPYDAQDGLFMEFNQIDASYSRRFGGTGLGLAITRRLVEAMNGVIRVNSEPDHGSVFSFTVQLRRGSDAEIVVPAADDMPRRRILFWGEGGITSSLLVKTLRSDGHSVTAVRTANEAVARMAEEDLDVVLIDGRPQDETGGRLVEMLRSKGCDLPIFLLRPYGVQSGGNAEGRDGRADGILSKPIKREDLARVMQTMSADTIMEDRARHDADEAQRRVGEGYRILLAEDSPTNRMVASALLRRVGYRVDWVMDGAEALDSVRRLPYDLVLMDVSMPNMDGVEATKAIRALPGEESQVPIVALTAHAMPGDRERFLQSGMDAYLTKPLQTRELIDTIVRFCPPNMGRICKPAPVPDLENREGAIVVNPAAIPQPATADETPCQLSDAPVEAPVLDNDAKSSPDDGSPVVDEIILRQLRKDAGEQAVPQLIEVFLNELSGRVERICEAEEGDDRAVIAKEAHALKSSAGSFGAMRLHSLAKALEMAARDDQCDTVTQLVARLPDVGEEAAEKFRFLLA